MLAASITFKNPKKKHFAQSYDIDEEPLMDVYKYIGGPAVLARALRCDVYILNQFN